MGSNPTTGVGAVGYNVNHVQVGDADEWIDVRGAQNWEPGVNIDTSDLLGDGGAYATAYGAPVGEGDITSIDPTPDYFARINGGLVSSSGTGATEIVRLEQPGRYVPVPFAISDFIPNIDKGHNPNIAGMRTTVPNATAEPLRRTSGQETEVVWTAATKFTPDENDQLIIYEWLASEPEFTDGVMEDVNLVRPTSG